MAIGLQIKRKAGLANVLESQKISSKKFSHYKKTILKVSLGTLVVSLVFISCFQLFRYIQTNIFAESSTIKAQDYKLQFQGPFTDPVRENIYKNIEAIFQKQNSEFHSLSKLAKEIQEKEGLAYVHIFLDIQNKLTISLTPRTPIMRLGGSSGKVISIEGDIYDDFNFTPKFQTTLLGVFPIDQQALKLDDRNCVVSTDKEKKVVLGALELLEKSEEHSLHYSSIEYKKYRGYFAKIQDTETTVVFGYPPFEKQFSRLSKILEDSKKNNKVLSNIEVDFADKAFITETRL